MDVKLYKYWMFFSNFLQDVYDPDTSEARVPLPLLLFLSDLVSFDAAETNYRFCCIKLTRCCLLPLSPCTWYQNLACPAELRAGFPWQGSQAHHCCKYQTTVEEASQNNKTFSKETYLFFHSIKLLPMKKWKSRPNYVTAEETDKISSPHKPT